MQTKTYAVEGMTCASCVAHVTKALESVMGVKKAEVNLLTNRAEVVMEEVLSDAVLVNAVHESGYELVVPTHFKPLILGIQDRHDVSDILHILKQISGITAVVANEERKQVSLSYNPSVLKVIDIIEMLKEQGYEVQKVTATVPTDDQSEIKEKYNLMVNLVLGALMLYITMGQMFAFKVWVPNIIDMELNPLGYTLVQIVLTIPMLILNHQTFSRGFKSLFKGSPNMDALVAVGTSAAVIYSLFGSIRIATGNQSYVHHLYYESAVVILALIRLGKYFEEKSKRKTTSAIQALLNLRPQTAILLRHGQEIEIDSDEIRKGDHLIVKPGQAIPMDGRILKGQGALDESMLTGESMPVDKEVGSDVVMGTLNLTGHLLIEVRVNHEESKLAQIIKLVEDAQNEKAPIAKIADAISAVFVPVVMVIAVVSGLLWFLYNGDVENALTIFVTVLVIACPCALGLATPTAIMVGTGKGAEKGIYIKSAEALENAAHIQTVVFDKTGTLTYGKPEVQDIISLEQSETELLQIAASLESFSDHPLAHAFITRFEKTSEPLLDVENFTSLTGLGLTGKIGGQSYFIGNEALMRQQNIDITVVQQRLQASSEAGKTVMLIADATKLLGLVAVADSIKEESLATVNALHQLGLHVVMLSGDNQRTATAIAQKLAIDTVIAEVLPEEKAAHIHNLQAQGQKLMMVGDGINDAVALVQSDVGIAIGSGTDVAMDSADIVLMKDNVYDVVEALRLSKATLGNIKQNLFWAFAYNIIGIPFAMGVYKFFFNGPLLDPMLAGAAMALSSVSVVGNALRLKRFKFKI